MITVNDIQYTERPYDHSKPARVYWNFHRKCFSIQQNRLVIGHCRTVSLIDIKFTVSEAGRQRVLRDRTKNVHAYAVGMLRAPAESAWNIRVEYNPYKYEHFYTLTDPEAAIHEASTAILHTIKDSPVILVSV